MTRWIGRSLLAIGIVHNIVGICLGYPILGELAAEGFVNTIATQDDRNAVFWFLFSGFALMLLGAHIDWCEREVGRLPGFLGWSLFALTVAGAAIMPQSGFWLLVVPTAGLMIRARRERQRPER